MSPRRRKNTLSHEIARNSLITASLMALGYVIAKSSLDEPVAISLARALKLNGADTAWGDAIIERADLQDLTREDPQAKKGLT